MLSFRTYRMTMPLRHRLVMKFYPGELTFSSFPCSPFTFWNQAFPPGDFFLWISIWKWIWLIFFHCKFFFLPLITLCAPRRQRLHIANLPCHAEVWYSAHMLNNSPESTISCFSSPGTALASTHEQSPPPCEWLCLLFLPPAQRRNQGSKNSSTSSAST